MTSGTARNTHRSMILVGGVLPTVVALAASIVMVSWLPELPDVIATHWGPSGPDGFGSPWFAILMPVGLTIAYAVFVLIASWKLRDGMLLPAQKLILSSVAFISGLLSVGITGTLYVQRGLEDAASAPDAGWWMLVGAGAGLAFGAIAWFLLPAAGAVADDGIEAPPLHLRADEIAVWSQRMRGLWRVTAGPAGLSVTGLGVRKFLPAESIESVRVVTVSPMPEFGGWGYRISLDGRFGVVLRAGEAIEVKYAGGRRFVVTVDDAKTGASVLSAAAAARRPA
jgi:hypothetical protein